MPLTPIDQQISRLINANAPIIQINSFEEQRVIRQLRESVRPSVLDFDISRMKQRQRDEQFTQQWAKQGRPLLFWTCTKGIYYQNKIEQDGHSSYEDVTYKNLLSPAAALKETLDDVVPSGIFVFLDLHSYLNPTSRAYDISAVRQLRELAEVFHLPGSFKTLIMISPSRQIPLELEKDIAVINYPLPTIEELSQTFQENEERYIRDYGQDNVALGELGSPKRQAIIQNFAGLTEQEALGVVERHLVDTKKLDTKVVAAVNEEKKQVILKSGTLDYYAVLKGYEAVGGIEALRDWLNQRKQAFAGEIKGDRIILNNRKIPLPRGILLIGFPGCGKSLVAKAVAADWNIPLVRLDVGKLFGSYLGETEANLRKAINIVEGLGRIVLWIDEIEKSFPQSTSSGDSGTSLRVLGTFLTWMQEKTTPVFVIATANDIERMPIELTRKGRFNEIFFIGLPDKFDRMSIFKIHLDAYEIPAEKSDLDDLAEATHDYTGAEIEQVVENAALSLAVDSSAETPHQIILREIKNIHPIARRIDENALLKERYKRAMQYAKYASGKAPEPLPAQGRHPIWLDPRQGDGDDHQSVLT